MKRLIFIAFMNRLLCVVMFFSFHLWKTKFDTSKFCFFKLKNGTYLKFGRSAFIADEEKVRLSVDGNLFFESAAFGRFLLHVGAGEVAMDQGRFAGRQRPDDAQTQIGHRSGQRPFLTIHERIWQKIKKSNGNLK